MKQSAIIGTALTMSLTAFGCSHTATNEAVADSNANTAIAVTNTAVNPTTASSGNINQTASVVNSAVLGIPNAPANLAVSKNDPTRNAKPRIIGRAAPNDSEITTSLAQDVVQTRTFKTSGQIAKIEVIGTEKKITRVYLRNGQVRDLPEGKIGDALSESPDNILKAVAASGVKPQAAPETGAQPAGQLTESVRPTSRRAQNQP